MQGYATGGPAGRFWEEAESQPHIAGVGCRALGLAQGLSLVRVLGNPVLGKQLHRHFVPNPQTLSTRPVGKQCQAAALVLHAAT